MPPRTARAAAAEVASHCVCFRLRKAARAATQVYDKALEPSGLRVTQFTLMVALALSEELTLSEVAERLVMDRTTLTANLKPLMRRGLVDSTVDPADRRGRRLSLTAQGQATLAAATPIWMAEHARIDEGLPDGTGELLRAGLRTLA